MNFLPTLLLAFIMTCIGTMVSYYGHEPFAADIKFTDYAAGGVFAYIAFLVEAALRSR